jgi:L-serine dehydratase
MTSIFDLFSIGIGPSSSHTVGPMRAALQFLKSDIKDIQAIKALKVTLYGSLAYTGKGHGTDKAILMGLLGEIPSTIDTDQVTNQINQIKASQTITLLKKHIISFNIEKDLIFNFGKPLPQHANGMHFSAQLNDGSTCEATYFSIGGGFIQHKNEMIQSITQNDNVPYPFNTAKDLLDLSEQHNLSIAEIMLANEQTWRDAATIRTEILKIADVMMHCINKGCQTEGFLEGRLGGKRRAPDLEKKLLQKGPASADHPQKISWLNVYAMAVNEENAAGGRVVTAPTNGAAGIIPAIVRYYLDCLNGNNDGIITLLLTAGAIGLLYKTNASISGAEMGCQGEVGVACSMAAAGLAAALGGTTMQIENAAEIGMEHNLGLTCDPVDGLVQIPCIERNAMGALKAMNAADLALAGDGTHHVSLDAVIKTMYEIGINMNSIYKETSQGGLAVNVPEC